MKKTIKGKFEIKGAPQPSDDTMQTLGAMRMYYEKKFEGPLTATSKVAMMGIMNQELISGGYVALERIEGTLDGRKGSFCLQHNSLMLRGQPTQFILVIPDSGTGELKGLSGTMVIDIVDSQHFYTFEYEVA